MNEDLLTQPEAIVAAAKLFKGAMIWLSIAIVIAGWFIGDGFSDIAKAMKERINPDA